MPIIRTVFRPWEEIEVSEEEAAAIERMGLLSRIELAEPETITAVSEAEPTPAAPAAAAEQPQQATGRRAKTTTTGTTQPEEVNTDGSSEEGGQVQEG